MRRRIPEYRIRREYPLLVLICISLAIVYILAMLSLATRGPTPPYSYLVIAFCGVGLILSAPRLTLAADKGCLTVSYLLIGTINLKIPASAILDISVLSDSSVDTHWFLGLLALAPGRNPLLFRLWRPNSRRLYIRTESAEYTFEVANPEDVAARLCSIYLDST